jgi:hypothetical protein
MNLSTCGTSSRLASTQLLSFDVRNLQMGNFILPLLRNLRLPLTRDRRIDWEAAKTRVLSVLKLRSERKEAGLSNAEIRKITHLDRY